MSDIPAIEAIYGNLFDWEDANGTASNWRRGAYPTAATAESAIEDGTMYVLVDGTVRGSVIINDRQSDDYRFISWKYSGERIAVIHTLCIDPHCYGKGYGSALVRFAIRKAEEAGCSAIRIDTWAGNLPAQRLYIRHGFEIAGSRDCLHMGIIEEKQVFLEKKLGKGTDDAER